MIVHLNYIYVQTDDTGGKKSRHDRTLDVLTKYIASYMKIVTFYLHSSPSGHLHRLHHELDIDHLSAEGNEVQDHPHVSSDLERVVC
jgi:hypothetical protein